MLSIDFKTPDQNLTQVTSKTYSWLFTKTTLNVYILHFNKQRVVQDLKSYYM